MAKKKNSSNKEEGIDQLDRYDTRIANSLITILIRGRGT
jgi:hypothetical protein